MEKSDRKWNSWVCEIWCRTKQKSRSGEFKCCFLRGHLGLGRGQNKQDAPQLFGLFGLDCFTPVKCYIHRKHRSCTKQCAEIVWIFLNLQGRKERIKRKHTTRTKNTTHTKTGPHISLKQPFLKTKKPALHTDCLFTLTWYEQGRNSQQQTKGEMIFTQKVWLMTDSFFIDLLGIKKQKTMSYVHH